MADLTTILGGAWSPPPEKRIDPPEVQLRDAISEAGLEPPDDIWIDGKIHRFRSGTKGASGHGDKTGWYIAFGDGVPAGRFGDWRTGHDQQWRADVGRKLSAAEEMAHSARMAEARAARDAELKKTREQAAETADHIWSHGSPASSAHPYLARKGIQPHGARVTGDGRLMVPLFDADGSLSSLQYIAHDGSKLYHPGGKTGGAMWIVGTMDEPGTLYVAEGFATAATIHEATGRPCAVAYSASNLPPVVGAMRERYGDQQDIVIVADHDRSGTGQKYADQASAKHGARVVMPPIEGMDANDYAQAGYSLAELLEPAQADWLISADEYSRQPAPIAWLIKRWVQSNALIMVHGPSGGGKTFVVLDWCLRMAAGIGEWCGQRVKQGEVIYLAGEGHHGLRSRIAAWKHKHQAGNLSMWLSRDGCDLNTPSGYLKAVEQIRLLQRAPALIVVDTLHRFLAGDENSAQDAKTMLDACNALMREFGCAVLLVHHTGVSDEAQHRARGSSAWRGALDIEISVVPSKDDKPMQIVQRKSKDAETAEPVWVALEQVTIPGWIDEDGEPVTSAVVTQAVTPEDPERRQSKVAAHQKMIDNAWWHCGAEVREGRPYLSRSGFMDYLMTKTGVKTEASAKQYMRPAAHGKPIADLINAGIIEAFEHGWIVVNDEQSSALLMRRGRA